MKESQEKFERTLTVTVLLDVIDEDAESNIDFSNQDTAIVEDPTTQTSETVRITKDSYSRYSDVIDNVVGHIKGAGFDIDPSKSCVLNPKSSIYSGCFVLKDVQFPHELNVIVKMSYLDKSVSPVANNIAIASSDIYDIRPFQECLKVTSLKGDKLIYKLKGWVDLLFMSEMVWNACDEFKAELASRLNMTEQYTSWAQKNAQHNGFRFYLDKRPNRFPYYAFVIPDRKFHVQLDEYEFLPARAYEDFAKIVEKSIDRDSC